MARGRFGRFLEKFVPDLRFASVWDLDPGALKRVMGVDHVIFDLENTLVPYKATALGEPHRSLIDRIRSEGIEVSVVSNSPASWVERVLDGEGVRFVAMAAKPRKSGFMRVIEEAGSEPGRTLHVGDQLITDVYGAHRVGLKAALVDPLSNRGPVTTHIQRRVLVPLLRFLLGVARLPDPLARPPR